jgi:hypothetical protein
MIAQWLLCVCTDLQGIGGAVKGIRRKAMLEVIFNILHV